MWGGILHPRSEREDGRARCAFEIDQLTVFNVILIYTVIHIINIEIINNLYRNNSRRISLD